MTPRRQISALAVTAFLAICWIVWLMTPSLINRENRNDAYIELLSNSGFGQNVQVLMEEISKFNYSSQFDLLGGVGNQEVTLNDEDLRNYFRRNFLRVKLEDRSETPLFLISETDGKVVVVEPKNWVSPSNLTKVWENSDGTVILYETHHPE